MYFNLVFELGLADQLFGETSVVALPIALQPPLTLRRTGGGLCALSFGWTQQVCEGGRDSIPGVDPFARDQQIPWNRHCNVKSTSHRISTQVWNADQSLLSHRYPMHL